MIFKIHLLIIGFTVLLSQVTYSQIIIKDKKEEGAFEIVSNNKSATIITDNNEDILVQKVGQLFSEDVERVTGIKPLISKSIGTSSNVIIIGTVGQSSLIKQLVDEKKLNVDSLNNKWEGYQIQVVKNPFKGVSQALVIAGSDRRGAAYGTMELSKQVGVSPWYWWADVPVKLKKDIYVSIQTPYFDAPQVKYRGFFINDEAPCLSRWAKESFGGLNHSFYEKVFELLLRLKANYLWPAMWNNAFNDDDKLNPELAQQWGIVMGTSHHEPMLRSQKEWKRFGKGSWNYEENAAVLKDFWKKGIENMGNHESIVTVGMRGDGDKPMTEGTATTLLEGIVSDQRKLIEEATGKPADKTPQVWALYKEVQDYYDKGMRVPDDITLLLSDDNWGNLRKLPNISEKKRAGGYGIYYHFDYVGDPRNYKWINTNNIARVWEQMHLAWEYGAKQIWIVNVGDIKPMEFPISFFMDYSWNPSRISENDLRTYYSNWAKSQFGEQYANEIGNIIRRYSNIASRKKPELLDANTYSLVNYDEFDRVVKECDSLLKDAETVGRSIPANYQDAYFQLVLHPIKAITNLHEMYQSVALNNYYANKNNPLANDYFIKTQVLFNKDSLISAEYNTGIANGKWNHMMDQVHIGYTTWNDPKKNILPSIRRVSDGVSSVNEPISNGLPPKSAETLIPSTENSQPVFFEKNGYVSMDAEHFSKAYSSKSIEWHIIPDIGRVSSGVTTFPVTSEIKKFGNENPYLAYDFYTYDNSNVSVNAYFSPTLNFHNAEKGLQYAISIDDEKPQIISINASPNLGTWKGWVADNIIIKKTNHIPLKQGKHVLKYWMVDAGVVLQKLVVDLGGVKQSYLGPPETKR